MTDDEYKDLMIFLFERYIRPRIPRVRHLYKRRFEDELSYHLDQAVRSAQILRFIESYCHDSEDVYRTFTPEKLKNAVSDTRYSLYFSNRLSDDAGFLDICESHSKEIIEGLKADYLPEADRDVLREMGSVNPEVELRSLVFGAKNAIRNQDCESKNAGIKHQLRYAEEKLKKADDEFDEFRKEKKEEAPEDVPKKPRRWFKGIGNIAQGAALSIANISLAIGTLKLPVSPETQTWGAIASVTTGVGTILNGIGELRNE